MMLTVLSLVVVVAIVAHAVNLADKIDMQSK